MGNIIVNTIAFWNPSSEMQLIKIRSKLKVKLNLIKYLFWLFFSVCLNNCDNFAVDWLVGMFI